jgi:uncharacterized protein
MRRTLWIGLLLTAACLGPRADVSSFFQLSPVAEPSGAAALPVLLGIGPVSVPGYLDRPQIVTRMSANELALAESDRWAEPLVDDIARTLRFNLAAHLPSSTYVQYPWYESESPEFAIAVEVLRFEADSAGVVLLRATWTVSSTDVVLERRTTEISEASNGVDRGAAVSAQSRALEVMSSEIAEAVRRASR